HQDDVLLCVFRFFRARGILFLQPAQVIDVIVMIANRDRKDLLRLVLLDDKPIEMRLDVTRQKIKDELLLGISRWLFLRAGLRSFRLRVSRKRNLVAEIRFHEFGKLCLKFFWRRKWRILAHRWVPRARRSESREANLASTILL